MPELATVMQPGRILAPAKLNLTLEILRLRPDGYHGIRSLVVPVALYDTLSWQTADQFSFTCSDAALENDENLVVRAARALGLTALPIAIHLEKNIPSGAGLGGGSSDAAALLLAAQNGAFGPQPPRDWLAIATALGSDVPLFLCETAALVEGRGDRVTALGGVPAWFAIIVQPDVHISTRAAYAQIDAAEARPLRPRSGSIGVRAVTAFQRHDFSEIARVLHNDFEAFAVDAHATLAGIFAAYRQHGIDGHLSGSGAASFVLCLTREAADAQAAELQAHAAFAGVAISIVPFAQGARYRPAPAIVQL